MYKVTLQVRLGTGEVYTQTFNVKEQLAAVRMFVLSQTSGGTLDGDIHFTFVTPFPRRLFSEDDMLIPLSELGMVVCVCLSISDCLFELEMVV